MKRDRKKVDAALMRIATQLSGSSSIFTDKLIENEPDLEGLDSYNVVIMMEQVGEIFLCDGCNWWCENEEMNLHENSGERFCNDCYETQNKDEDSKSKDFF